MGSKPDKEWQKRGDIGLLSEIIKNSRYWKESTRLGAPHTGPETTIYHKWRSRGIVSIYLNRGDIWFLIGDICKILFCSSPQYIVYPQI
jgi:hypothetical protein